jgi:polyisoprenoid-binding protein YceI
MTLLETSAPPGYRTGTWVLDPSHSEVGFSVRHLMVSKVRGRFTRFDASFTTAENPLASSLSASVDLASVETGDPDRDAHLRSPDFLDVEQNPTMAYRSTGIRRDGDAFAVDGELSLHGVTRSVPLRLEVHGFQASPFGDTRAGFTATAEIDRRDFGMGFNAPLEGGGVLVGHTVEITLEVEAILEDSND